MKRALVTILTALTLAVGLASVPSLPASADHGYTWGFCSVTCFGTNHDDSMNGSDVGDHFVLYAGNDTGVGYGNGDIMEGRAGNDLLEGRGGPDQLYGGGGNDALYGGPGDDILVGGNGGDWCFGGDGHDKFKGCEVQYQDGANTAAG